VSKVLGRNYLKIIPSRTLTADIAMREVLLKVRKEYEPNKTNCLDSKNFDKQAL